MKFSIQTVVLPAAFCAPPVGLVPADAPPSNPPTTQQPNSPPLHSPDTPIPRHADTNPLSLDHVLRDVLQNNPSLKAARANWEAIKQRVPQARAWEDARAGFDTVAGRFVSISPNSFTDQKLMLE